MPRTPWSSLPLLAVLAIAGPSAAAAPPPDPAAREALLSGLDQARPWLQAFGAASGRDGDYLVRRALGDVLFFAPDPARAIPHWQAAARAGLSSGDPKLRRFALSRLSNLGFRTGDFALAMDAERRARDAARRGGERGEEVRSTLDMGTLATLMNDLDGSEQLHRTALAGFRELGDRQGEARALRGLGRIMEGRGRLASAVTLQVEGLALMQQVGRPLDVSESYFSLGRLFISLEDYEAAELAIGEALARLPDSPGYFPRGLNLINLAVARRMQGRFEQALADVDAALAIMRANGSVPGQAMASMERGQVLAGLGRVEESVQVGREGVELARRVGDQLMINDGLLALAANLNVLGRHAEALALLGEVLDSAERMDLDRYRADGGVEMEKALAGLGRPAEALEWSRRARAARERVTGIARLGRLAEDGSPAALAEARGQLMVLAAANDAPAAGGAEAPALPAATASPAVDLATPLAPQAIALLALFALGLAWGLVRTVRHLRRVRREKDAIARRTRELEHAHTTLRDQSEQLRRQATLDPLTGCLVRSAFAQELEALLMHAASHRRSVALLVFDLDHFKAVNDGLGHLAGDEALRLVSGLTRTRLRSDDLFGRFGGDEFLVACEGRDAAAAEALAEAIRFDLVFRAPDHSPPMPGLSLSVGVAIADPARGYEPEDLFRRADVALYRAKRSGRNRVELDDPGQPGEASDRRARQWGGVLAD